MVQELNILNVMIYSCAQMKPSGQFQLYSIMEQVMIQLLKRNVTHFYTALG